jgi:hypothetical protein
MDYQKRKQKGMGKAAHARKPKAKKKEGKIYGDPMVELHG